LETLKKSSKNSRKDSKKDSKKEKKGRREGGTSGGGGVREEIASLRNQLGDNSIDKTPQGGETLRQFYRYIFLLLFEYLYVLFIIIIIYSRTSDFWTSEVVRIWKENNSEESKSSAVARGEVMSEKELKREGFRLSEIRYTELLPILSRITELEDQQKEEEDSKSKSSSSKRR
jgi:hypothetical protein